MKRFISVDWGGRRIGFARSDPLGMFAYPLKVITRPHDLEKSCVILLEELKTHLPLDGIILGLPLQLSGNESPGSLEIRKIALFLEEQKLCPIHLIDERLSSKMANTLLKESGMSRKARSKIEDASAAAIILQSFLDRQRASGVKYND